MKQPRFAAALCGLLTVALAAGFIASGRADEGRAAPDYGARLLGGEEEATLASLRGKAVLLNTWATWCAPCRVEMPDFEAFYQRYRERGLEIVGVNIDEGEADQKVERFIEKMGVTFSIWRDPRNRFAKRFRVLGVPATLLIDRNGVIIHHWEGPMNPGAAENLALIEQALGPAKSSGSEPSSDTNAALQRGRRIAEQRGCLTCHTTDGAPNVGPTWKGLLGAPVALDNGNRFPRDSAYLKRAIVEPDVEIVAGYSKGVMSGAMPGRPLSETEVEALVRYLESL